MFLTFKLLSTILLVSISTSTAAIIDGVPCLVERPPATLGGWGTIAASVNKKPVVSMGGWGTAATAVKPPAATKGGWGTIAESVNKKPVVSMGSWGAPAAVNLGADERAYKYATHDVFAKDTFKAVDKAAVVLGADETAYKHGTHGVFPIATHEAALSTELANLKLSHGKLAEANFTLNGALGFAEIMKVGHTQISAYFGTGKTFADSLAAGERTPWCEDATVLLVAPLNVNAIGEFLSDGVTAISSLSDAAAFAMLDGVDSADKSALIAGLQAEAARIDAAASDTSGTTALDALLTNLQIRAFVKRVG